MVIAVINATVLKEAKSKLNKRFKMKDLGKLKSFLGIYFEEREGSVKMPQKRYVYKILERFGMQDCRCRETPCSTKILIQKEMV